MDVRTLLESIASWSESQVICTRQVRGKRIYCYAGERINKREYVLQYLGM